MLLDSLRELAPFWKAAPPQAAQSDEAEASSPWIEDLAALGWLEAHAFEAVARDVMARELLDPLATIGIEISSEERASVLLSPAHGTGRPG